jgi:hypothetical protein
MSAESAALSVLCAPADAAHAVTAIIAASDQRRVIEGDGLIEGREGR